MRYYDFIESLYPFSLIENHCDVPNSVDLQWRVVRCFKILNESFDFFLFRINVSKLVKTRHEIIYWGRNDFNAFTESHCWICAQCMKLRECFRSFKFPLRTHFPASVVGSIFPLGISGHLFSGVDSWGWSYSLILFGCLLTGFTYAAWVCQFRRAGTSPFVHRNWFWIQHLVDLGDNLCFSWTGIGIADGTK